MRPRQEARTVKGLDGCSGSSFDSDDDGEGRKVRQRALASQCQNKQRRNVSQV